MKSVDEFTDAHESFMAIPEYAFMKSYVPNVVASWDIFVNEINAIQQKEIKEYTAQYGKKMVPDLRTWVDNRTSAGSLMTPQQFIKAAQKCASAEEYEVLYNDHGKYFRNANIRSISHGVIGIFNAKADIPLLHLEDTPENHVKLHLFADEKFLNLNKSIPTPEEIRTMGLEYLKEVDERLERDKTPEYQKHVTEKARQPETFRHDDTDFVDEHYKIFVTKAFVSGTMVPPFVMAHDNKFTDFSGYIFEKQKGLGSVVLSKGGKTVEIDSSFYNSIIENSKIMAAAPAVTPEVIKKYEQAASLDHNKMRDNTASNFWHNYRVMCRQNATNASDAMKIANEIMSKMPAYEQLHFQREVKAYNQRIGLKNGYNERLINFYNENVKDLPVTHSIFGKDLSQVVSDQYHDVIKKTGDRIDKNSNSKIGDIVKMSFNFKDIATGEDRKLPPKEYILIAASEDKNKVVLVDKDNLSKYTISRDEFLKHMQKLEKSHKKDHKKEQRREMKEALVYSY